MLFIKDNEIEDDSLQDMCYFVGCGSCKHFNVRADMDGVESTCKRIDHKHIQFAKPWFKSYDCGQQSSIMCNDFEPAERCVDLCRRWTDPIDYACKGDESRIKGKVWLCLDKDQSVRYAVTMRDFWYGTFLNEDGSLKWIEKMYYKRSKKSPICYELVREDHEGNRIR